MILDKCHVLKRHGILILSENMKEQNLFNIGKYSFDTPLVLAPMDGITNMPFRIICRKLGADLIYNEFIQAEAFPKLTIKNRRKLDFSDHERPLSLQVYSGDKELMVNACKILENEFKPDFIDLNFGCWKPKICKRFAGAGALQNPDLMIDIIESCVAATSLPITVKTRLGWDENSIIIDKIAPRIEEAGAKALALHCRTRKQGMRGDADWSLFNDVKASLSIPVFLNGDIVTPEDAKNALEITNADGLMIGRAALDDPFIFKYIKDYLKNGEYEIAPPEEKFEICKEHLNLLYEYKGDHGIKEFRKFYKKYLYNIPNIEPFLKKIVRIDEYSEVMKLLGDVL